MMVMAMSEDQDQESKRQAYTLSNAPTGDIENLRVGFQRILDNAAEPNDEGPKEDIEEAAAGSDKVPGS